MRKTFQDYQFSRVLDYALAFIMPVLAVVAALALGAIMLWLLDVDPREAYENLYNGAVGVSRGSPVLNIDSRSETFVKAIPLLFVGIGICIAFRAGVINVGGEGQMIAGAVVGTAVALEMESIPGIFTWVPWDDFPRLASITVVMFSAFVGGAVWGSIAGVLKAYFNVNEILSTIMLNQIAFQVMFYLLKGDLQDPRQQSRAGGIAKTVKVPEHTRLPRLTWFTDVNIRLHAGLLVAIALAVLVYVLLWRTTYGYRIRAVGKNPRAARYAGINVRRQVVYAMVWSGGFAGLAGI
ncbi:MAG: ABC transporter permease, partial [Chloroflexi bacterium]|nr:ABC transporter permease [Chloroflexota bacterium]